MKYLHLIVAALLRKKTRTVLTLLSVVAAFTLFGFLDAVRVAFNAPDSVAGLNRLIVTNKYSIIESMPQSYLNRLRALPGVRRVAHADWFGGVYQDPKNFFANYPVNADYLDVYPEIVLAPDQRRAFETTRTGAVVGRALADKYGWSVGDRIPLQATIYPRADGSLTWEFDLVGIYDASSADLASVEQLMLFHYDYFDEGRQFGKGEVGWYIVEVENSDRAAEVARAIDAMFANSAFETKTQSEREFNLAFARQIGDIGLIVSAIMVAVFFTLVLVTGNTMSQAIRDRIPELAVMKTLGFSNRFVLVLVLVESIFLLLLGGMLGMALARGAIPAIGAASGGMMALTMSPQTWINGALLMLLIGVAVGAPPALKAMRLKIVDALRG